MSGPRLVRVVAACVAALVLTASSAAQAGQPDPPGSVVFDPASTMPGGLRLDGRRLVTGEAGVLSDRSLGAAGSFALGPWRAIGADLYPNFCNGTCYHLAAAGAKTAYAMRVLDAATSQYIHKIIITGRWGALREFTLSPTNDVQLVSMTTSLLAYRLDGVLKLYDIDNGHEVAFPRPSEVQFSFALDGRRVWTPTTYGGPQIIGEDANGGQISVTLPQACPTFEGVVFQVVNHWLAWGCSGVNTIYRGVIDLNTGVNKPIYAENSPVLGDGFLVQIASGAHPDGYLLQLIDFTQTSPVTTDLSTMDWGTFPQLSAWEGIRWAVDRSGGQSMAWVEGNGKIHVLPLGVPASPLRLGSATLPAKFTPNFDGVDDVWHPVWEVSKPVTWSMTLRRNGLTVRQFGGSGYGAAVTPEWNGSLTGWARFLVPARDGVYTFTLTVTPADGVGGVQTVNGSVELANAIALLRPAVVPRKG
jgi:hypothetical protein